MSDNLLAPKPTKSKFTPKQVATFYFKPLLTEDGDPTGLQACKACGKTRKHAPKTGYTNLASHVRSDHPRFQAEMEEASTAAKCTLLPWVSQKASNRYAWLLWVVKGNLPFSFVEMETTRRYTNLPSVYKEVLGHDMENVTKAVEKDIGAILPGKFGMILDDCTHGTEHYMAAYACFELNGVRHCPLLSLAPVINGPDDRLNAESHMASLAACLPFFGKDLANVIFLVGDNCAMNKRLARLMGVPLVGYASHRLNLAVHGFLDPYEEGLEQAQSLMKRLRTISQAAKLRLKTSLRPKLGNETRWSSTYTMLARYFELREFISAEDEELDEEMPSPAANRRLKALLAQLADVESVSKKLQSKGLNLLDARDLLDGLLEIQPSFANYLGTYSGVVKVLAGQEKRLSRPQRAALQPFSRAKNAAGGPTGETGPTKMGFADRILKRRKVEVAPSAYELLAIIPPTSNIVERLFSVARMVLRYERNRMTPLTLEMVMFLKVNEGYWDVTTVDACIWNCICFD
ncbi:unnamed protein product [Phytophthora fragariaefolia]|uniref:Unnamed protein product n=1 Tax=Phytophthora fragariaefolia TaxID=1490495 RepID=A0A9W7CYP8_9STRA|nr:unnamed protein product [Phytophthora fragariaefolia]